MDSKASVPEKLNFGKAAALLILAIAMLVIAKTILGGDTSIALIVASAAVSALALLWGVKWDDIEGQIKDNIKAMTVPIMILMCVGMLVGVWICSGTIPTMIYYGMKFLSPRTFLIMTCLIACLMSVMTGTSWGTVSTVGVALMGVSVGLGVPVAYTAGAITAGAIFGDKLSPLSDTTVLAAAVADVNIVDHIKYMLYTTIPCLLISLALYGLLGARYTSGDIGGGDYALMMETLQSAFYINPILMIPPVVVLGLIMMRKPTVPTFFMGIVAAMLLAAIFQGTSFKEIILSMGSGFTKSTDVALVDKIVVRGGLKSMLSTIVLVLSAGIFGAPLKASGAIELLISKVDSVVRNEKQMMVSVGVLHIILFLMVVSYYVSFIIIGNMTKGLYDKYKLNRVNLSRTLEDTGTAIAPLIPWGLSGAFYSSTLGLPVTEFVMYAPITYLSCVFGALYAVTGFTIAKTGKG